MANLPFGLSAYSRASGRLPPVRLVNMYSEQAPTSSTGVVLLPRLGLRDEYSLPDVLRGVYLQDGVFGGATFAVSGETLFNGEVEVGEVEGTDQIEWAYTVDGLFILGGGIVYQSEDGITVEATEFPDDAPVASITAIDNFLVAVRQDTGTVYFRVPGDTTWNALDFFSAEREPDPAICVRTLTDLLYVFGTSSIEPFTLTGNAEAPFSRLAGSGADRGTKDRDSVVRADNTLVWVGENNIPYRLAGVPQAIANPGIVDAIQRSGTASAWTYSEAGHTFYVLKLDEESLAYDLATGEWHTLEWSVSTGAYDGNTAYACSGDTICTLQDRPDDYDSEITRIFTAVAPTERPGTCDCIEVALSPGTTPILDEPAELQMRWSDDQARTWTDWRTAYTGFGGQYRTRVRYRRLGMIDSPGRVFEFRMTDPVEIRFSGVDMNPPNGGRSRG
jgi:hypothetical protein